MYARRLFAAWQFYYISRHGWKSDISIAHLNDVYLIASVIGSLHNWLVIELSPIFVFLILIKFELDNWNILSKIWWSNFYGVRILVRWRLSLRWVSQKTFVSILWIIFSSILNLIFSPCSRIHTASRQTLPTALSTILFSQIWFTAFLASSVIFHDGDLKLL